MKSRKSLLKLRHLTMLLLILQWPRKELRLLSQIRLLRPQTALQAHQQIRRLLPKLKNNSMQISKLPLIKVTLRSNRLSLQPRKLQPLPQQENRQPKRRSFRILYPQRKELAHQLLNWPKPLQRKEAVYTTKQFHKILLRKKSQRKSLLMRMRQDLITNPPFRSKFNKHKSNKRHLKRPLRRKKVLPLILLPQSLHQLIFHKLPTRLVRKPLRKKKTHIV